MSLSIAIIGGGYAGMAAAMELASRGVRVSVFEAGPVLGGRARRITHRGVDLDNGAHILLGAYHETLRLMQLAGAPKRALLRLPLRLIVKERMTLRAAPLPAPLHLLAGLMSATGLRLSERFAAVRFMNALRRAQFRLPADTTVAAMLAAHGQHGALAKYLWEPLCIAALNTPPAKASARIFLNVLRDGLARDTQDSQLMLPRIDLSRLFPDRAADYVRGHRGAIELLSPVTRIEVNSSQRPAQRFTLLLKDRREIVGGVICAAGPREALRLLSTLHQGAPADSPLQPAPLPQTPIDAMAHAIALIEQFTYQPICTVYLQYATAVALPDPMLGLADGLVQWLFDRQALQGQQGVLAAVMSAAGAEQALSNDTIGGLVAEEIAHRFPAFGLPLWSKVVMEKFATFSCTPNLKRPAQKTPLERFYLAGDYTAGDYPATLEAAVQSGVKCAQLLMADVLAVEPPIK